MTSEATSASDWANFVSTLHKDFTIGSGRSRFARSTVLFATPQHATNESTIYDSLNDDEGSAEKKQEKEDEDVEEWLSDTYESYLAKQYAAEPFHVLCESLGILERKSSAEPYLYHCIIPP